MSTTTTTDQALALLASLRLADGRPWGEVATAHQWADARAVLDTSGPRRHWIGRSRGYSKTGDVAGMALAAMLSGQLAPGSMVYAAASDKDQAALLLSAVRNYVVRTPELQGQVTVQAGRVVAERSGVILEVLAADAASSYGLLPSMLLLDELCQWPKTANARDFFTALTSALPKVPGSRSVVLTTAGDPSHWSHKVYNQAVRSERWRVSEVHGPAPWQNPAEVEEQRLALMPSVFQRLFENRWTASEDRLVDPADLDAAMTLPGNLDPLPGVRYVISIDLGLKKDSTVVVVAHRRAGAEKGAPRVVVDRLCRWRGTRDQPVQIEDVERAVVALSEEFNRAPVFADPWQAMGLIQRLKARRVSAAEFPFTSQSVGRLAHGLYSLLRSRRIDLPNDEMLRDELLGVRLRETHPGQYRMDHDSAGHDDQAVAIAVAAHQLIGVPQKRKVRAEMRFRSYL